MSRVLFLVWVCFLLACSPQDCYYDFLNKHENDRFDIFLGSYVFTRGFDFDKNPIFFIETVKNRGKFRYIVRLDSKVDSVLSLEKQNIRDKIVGEEIIENDKQIKEIAIQFNKLDIYSLESDTSGNLFIKTQIDQSCPMLFKMSHKNSENQKINSSKRKYLRGKWYIQLN